MKKLLFIATFCMSVIYGNAQIRTEILGLSLGNTSPLDVKNILSKNNLKVSPIGMGTSALYAEEVFYAGVFWSFVMFEFHNNRLCNIEFVFVPSLKKNNNIQQQWNSLYERIKGKYTKYIKINQKEGHINCSDSITILEAGFKYKNKENTLVLHYMDIDLMTEKVNAIENEI